LSGSAICSEVLPIRTALRLTVLQCRVWRLPPADSATGERTALRGICGCGSALRQNLRQPDWAGETAPVGSAGSACRRATALQVGTALRNGVSASDSPTDGTACRFCNVGSGVYRQPVRQSASGRVSVDERLSASDRPYAAACRRATALTDGTACRFCNVGSGVYRQPVRLQGSEQPYGGSAADADRRARRALPGCHGRQRPARDGRDTK